MTEVLEALPERIVVCSGAGVVLYANPLAESLLGRSSTALAGCPFAELLLGSAGLEESHQRLLEMVAAGVDTPSEIVLRHSSGVRLHAELVGRRSKLGGRDVLVLSLRELPVGSVTTKADVASVYRPVFERAPVGILHVDANGVITAANDAFAAIIGSPKRVLVGLQIRSLPNAPVVGALNRALAGEVAHYDGPYDSATGQKHTEVQLLFAPIHDDAGHVTGAVGIVLDVTQTKEAERALAHSLDSLHRVMEQAPDGIIITRHGHFVLLNSRAVEMLGYASPNELLGTPVADFLHPDEREILAQRIASIAAGGPHRPYEYQMRHRDGRYLRVEVKSIAFEYDGEPAVLSFGRDVTERRELEARLRQADRMASIGTLAAGVAHEINNPLAYVMMTLGVLERRLEQAALTDGEGPFTEDILRMQEGCDRIRTIVRDLLTFARHREENYGPVDINQLVTSSVNIVRHTVRHRAHVDMELSPRLPLVRGDETGLGQVLVNLLVNAAHAIPESSVDLHCIRVVTEADGRRVRISVIDDGVGIPPEVLPRIFEPFFSTKAPGVGTGLGLAICHGIVRSHNGVIRVESQLGKGSKFVVDLPVEATSANRHLASRSAELLAVPPSRILVIDDEVALGDALRAMLADKHEVTVARSGQEGVEAMSVDADYDLVLCDVMMPDIGGLSVYEAVREQTPWLARRFVFMTGGALTERTREMLEFSDRPRLWKPFSREDVESVLRFVRDAEHEAAE